MLAAMALGIFAAAGPQIRRSATDRPVVIIVDRGITMSARSGSLRRFQALANTAEETIFNTLGPGPARLIAVPSGEEQTIDRADLSAAVSKLAPTAADSRAALADAVRLALQPPRAIVILLSDRPVDVTDDRLVRIVPEDSLTNIGVESLSVRSDPTPQVMVHIVSDLPSINTTLTVTGASPIQIRSPGDYFVDLPSVPDVLSATISPGGDIDADDQAWAVRDSAWPKLLPADSLPPELRRVIDAYSKNRPPREDSPAISILPLGETDNAAALAMSESTPLASATTATIEAAADSLAQGVDWSTAVRGGQFTQAQPGPGFTRLVWSGDRILVAMRSQPTRQIWVGFRSTNWTGTPQFVVFWTKVFDWLGQTEPKYSSAVAGAPGVPLWPGLYGHLAVNAAPVPNEIAAREDWPNHLVLLAGAPTAAMFSYGSWLLAAAVGCCLLAALLLR
jgi:hypothetical protein